MLLQIFLALLALSVALVALGHWVEDDGYRLTGFLFLFLLGTYLITGIGGGLEVQTGENNSVTFTYLADNTTLDTAEEVVVNVYETKQYRTFGIFLSLGSAFALMLTFFRLRRSPDE